MLALACFAGPEERIRGQRLQPPRGQQGPAGLSMWHFPHRDADRFELAVWIGAGARDEDPRKAGLAEDHWSETLTLKRFGTESFGATVPVGG